MSVIHPKADVAECSIGHGTKIWQFVVILKGAVVGENCNICAHSLIEGDVVIGDRVTIKSGVFVWNGLTIEDDVFVGPNVSFTNDLFPRSKMHLDTFPSTTIKKGASLGANSTILAGLKVGSFSMVGAGAVVVRDVPDYAVVVGNPAKIIRYLEK
jgi:UDP-2-acetamido-3-amino-2,3-dideoxy-glucuronate N-acetyltransferase